MGFDRGPSLRWPTFRRTLSLCFRVMLIISLLLACGAGVIALSNPALIQNYAPTWLGGNGYGASNAAAALARTFYPSPSLSPDHTQADRPTDDATPEQTESPNAELMPLATLPGFPAHVDSIATDATGNLIVVIGADRVGGFPSVLAWKISREVRQSSSRTAALLVPLRFAEPRPTAAPTCAAVSDDGALVAVGHADGRLDLVSMSSGGARYSVAAAHRRGVTSLAICQDHSRVVSTGADGFLRSFALPHLSDPRSLAVGEPLAQVSLSSAAGFSAVLGRDGRVRLVSLATMLPVGGAWVHGAVENLVLSADGSRIAATTRDRQGLLVRAGTNDVLVRIKSPPMARVFAVANDGRRALCLTGDGRLVALGASGELVELYSPYDEEGGSAIEREVVHGALLSDGRARLVLGDGTLAEWRPPVVASNPNP